VSLSFLLWGEPGRIQRELFPQTGRIQPGLFPGSCWELFSASCEIAPCYKGGISPGSDSRFDANNSLWLLGDVVLGGGCGLWGEPGRIQRELFPQAGRIQPGLFPGSCWELFSASCEIAPCYKGGILPGSDSRFDANNSLWLLGDVVLGGGCGLGGV
jgi:hypothetical protein